MLDQYYKYKFKGNSSQTLVTYLPNRLSATKDRHLFSLMAHSSSVVFMPLCIWLLWIGPTLSKLKILHRLCSSVSLLCLRQISPNLTLPCRTKLYNPRQDHWGLSWKHISHIPRQTYLYLFAVQHLYFSATSNRLTTLWRNSCWYLRPFSLVSLEYFLHLRRGLFHQLYWGI